MDRDEAIEKLLQHSNVAKRTVDRLCMYDPSMSLAEYSAKLKVGLTNASNFLHSYGIIRSRKDGYRMFSDRTRKKYGDLWDTGKTIKENAKAIKRSPGYASVIAKRYGFSYAHHTKTQRRVEQRINRVMSLLNKGLTQSEVARVFNVSREYIRQLKNNAKSLGIRK